MRVVACKPHENPHEPWIYHKFKRHICYKCEVKQLVVAWCAPAVASQVEEDYFGAKGFAVSS